MLIHSNSNDSIVNNYAIGQSILFSSSYEKPIYSFIFPYGFGDARERYCVFEINNSSDTIRDFYYEPVDTILNCGEDCSGLLRGGITETQTFTTYNNFHFIYKNDTIKEYEAIVIQN